MTLPLLFLDVDGTLIPFGGNGYPTGHGSNPLLARINPALGPRLRGLNCELVWATTWMHEANESIAPLLGLPPLTVMTWPDDDEPETGPHWKTRAIAERAGDRPFVWLDDEITDRDRRWVSTHHAGPALLHTVTAAIGVTGDDLDVVARWLGSLVHPDR